MCGRVIFLLSVQGSTIYVTYYNVHNTGFQERIMSGVIAAETKDYEFSLERRTPSDNKLYITLTNLTDNTVPYSSSISSINYNALVGAPVFVGGTQDRHIRRHVGIAPNAGQLITK